MGNLNHQNPRSTPFNYTVDLVCNVVIFSNFSGSPWLALCYWRWHEGRANHPATVAGYLYNYRHNYQKHRCSEHSRRWAQVVPQSVNTRIFLMFFLRSECVNCLSMTSRGCLCSGEHSPHTVVYVHMSIMLVCTNY